MAKKKVNLQRVISELRDQNKDNQQKIVDLQNKILEIEKSIINNEMIGSTAENMLSVDTSGMILDDKLILENMNIDPTDPRITDLKEMKKELSDMKSGYQTIDSVKNIENVVNKELTNTNINTIENENVLRKPDTINENFIDNSDKIKELSRSVSDLENTVLLILEKMRRTEKYAVVQTKKGKIIPPKISLDDAQKLVPANDPESGEDLEKSSSKDILVKMYNFMVRNSEKQNKKDQNERKEKRSLEKKKEVNYRKELIKSGFDPKFFKKKRGLLGKIGTGIKWGIFGAIGTGLAGLIWLFKDEILASADSVKKSLEEFGTYLTQKFNVIKKAYDYIKGFLGPVLGQIDSVLGKGVGMLGGSDKPLSETVSTNTDSLIKWVQDFVSEMLNGLIDRITEWASSIAQPILDWYNKGTLDKATDIFDFSKEHAGVLAAFAARMVGGPFGMAVGGLTVARGLGKASSSLKEFTMKSKYGEDYIDTVRQIVNLMPEKDQADKARKERAMTDLYDLIDDPEKLKEVIEGPTAEKPEEKSARITSQMELVQSLPHKQKEYLNKVMGDLGYTMDEKETQRVRGMQKDQFSALKITPTYVNKEGQTLEGEKLFSTLMTEVPLKEIKQKGREFVKEYVVKPLEEVKKEKVDPIVSQVDNKIEEAKDKAEEIKKDWDQSQFKNTATETATKIGQTTKDAASAVKQEVANVSTSEQAMVATGNLASKATDVVNENVINPLAQKTSKFGSEDFFKTVNEAYSKTSQTISDVSGTMSQFDSWDKMSAFFSKMVPEQKQIEVKQDPNEDPFNMNTMLEQAKQTSITSNKVMNNRTTSSSLDNFSFPKVRNDEASKQWCVIDSICKP